uniref:Beta-1,4-galactosyltransferase 7 n=1 Tax=Rhabditophanes sp. KR3021 TaxID=114890 RepID=A0AC35TSC8_9BILA
MGKKSMSVVDSIVEFSESDNATFETPARHTQLVERKKSKKDLVMLFGDQTVKNIQSVTFREVTFQNGEVQYCLNDPNNQSSTLNVGSLKRKNLTDSGNEYLVAYVNKKTKKATFKPVELISMSSQVVGDKDAWLKGEIAVKNVDYGTNNAIKTDEFLSKRNNLTNDFGSTKKRQMLNDVDKRRVDQDTMLALADTAFSSITNMDKKVDHNVSGIAAITSMEKQTQGNILPKFNGDAKKPENIYPVDQFISEENYNELSELSVDFFESKETEELATLGVSKMIIALISSLRKQSDKKKFGYLLMKCHIMFKIAISVGKSKRYYKADEVGLPDVPADFRSLVEHEFFGDCEPAKTGLRSIILNINTHKLCVIVPYRDRYQELTEFVPHISEFLDKQKVVHSILVMNQTDQFRFNRASMINVGYKESDRLRCDYMVMHDVDLLPLNQNLSYTFPGNGSVKHISAGPYHPIKRYDYKKFIGGVLMLTMADYKKVNGMSNKYWGWGLEDDEFFLRLKDAGLTDHIVRPQNLTTDRSNTFKHIHGKERKRDYVQVGIQKKFSRQRDRISGLESTSYEIKSRTVQTFANTNKSYQAVIINVNLHCDLKWTPYCKLVPT